MLNGLNYKTSEKRSLHLGYLLFAFGLSIFDGFLGYKSNWVCFLGEGVTVPDRFEGLMVTVFFLMAWLLYGTVIGYMKKESFIQFLSLFWGIGGGISLLATLMAPVGKFALFAIPIELLILLPNYGLKPYLVFSSVRNTNNLLFIFLSVLFAWLIGLVGYLLGFQLKNFLTQSKKNKNK